MKYIYPLCALGDFPFFKRLGRVFFLLAFFSAGYPIHAQINNYSQSVNVYDDTTVQVNVGGYLDGRNSVSLASNYFPFWSNLGNFCTDYIKAFEPLREISFQNQGSQPVTGLSFYTNQYYYSNLDSLARQIFANKVTSREKAMAVFHFVKSHHLYYFAGDQEAYDPTKFINNYGFGHCGNIANTTTWLTSLYTDTNQRNIWVNTGNHAVSEVNFDSSWVYVDADQGGYYLLPDNKSMASFLDVYLDSYWYLRTKQFGAPLSYLPSQMQTFSYQVRAGNHFVKNIDTTLNTAGDNFYVAPSQPLKFDLAPWDKVSLFPADTISVAHYTAFPPGVTSPANNTIKPMIGKGVLIRNLINPEAALNKSFGFTENITRAIVGPDTILRPTNFNQKGVMIFKMTSPYPMVDAELNITAYLNSLNDSLKIFFSKDSLNWTAVSDTLQAGSNDLSIDLFNNIATTAEAATYNYYIKVEMDAASSPSGCTIKLLRSTGIFQYSRFASPSFVLNNNTVKVYTESASPNLKMDLKWQENFSNTPPNAPASPIYPLSGTTIDSSYFTFRWPPATDPNGDAIKDYQIQVSDRPDMQYTIATLFDRTLYFPFAGNVQNYFRPEVNGYLNNNTTYYWRVRALDNKRTWGPWSNVWSFKVKGVMYPQNLHFELYNNQTSDSLKLTWTLNANGKAPALYKVYGSNNTLGFLPDSASFINNTTNPFYKVTTAQSKQRYRIIAQDTLGGQSSSSYFVNHPSNNMMKTGVYGDTIAPFTIIAPYAALNAQPYPPASTQNRELFCLYDTAYFNSAGNNKYVLKKVGKAFMNVCTRINQDTVYLFQLLYTINKATLVVSTPNRSSAYGSPIVLGGYTCSGLKAGDDSVSAFTTLPNVVTTAVSTQIGNYPITVSGGVSAKYNLIYQNATYTVGKAPLVITANNVTKTYGDAISFNGVTYSGFVNGENAGALTTLPSLSTTYTNGAPVGTYTVTPSGAVAQNYDITYQGGTYTVGKAGLVITANNVIKVYGDPISFNGVTYSGFVNGEDYTVLSLAPILTTTYNSGDNIGVYTVTAFGASATNYNITYQNGTYTVVPAGLIIRPNNVSTVYGDPVIFDGITYSGFVNDEDTSVLTTLPVINTTYTTANGIGTYALTASGASATNYNITYQAGVYKVDKAVLTITANNVTKVYGDPVGFNGITYTGFVNGEDSSVLTTLPVLNTTYIAGDTADTYAVTVSGASAQNYDITYQDGTYTVGKADLVITANNVDKTYGDPINFNGFTYTGFVNGEDSSVLTSLPELTTSYQEGNDVGAYSLTAAGANAVNYDITYQNGTYMVTKADLLITANDVYLTYGNPLNLNGVTYSGFVYGEDSSVLTIQPALTTNYSPGDPVSNYNIVPGGASATNYNINYQNGTLYVSNANLWVVANDAVRTYGEQPLTNGYYYVGFVNGDTEDSLTTPPSITTTATLGDLPGTYSITVSGASSPNYIIDYIDGTMQIDRAPLTITAKDTTSVYGTAPVLNGYTYNGFVLNENENILTTPPVIATIATAGSPVGNYPISIANATSDRYLITFINGNLEVKRASLTIKPINSATTYGNDPVLNGIMYNGFVNNDTSDVLNALPVAETQVTRTSNAGTYPIIVGNASEIAADNYTIHFQEGVYQVNKKDLAFTVRDTSKLFGDPMPPLQYQIAGFVNNDNESHLDQLPTITTQATDNSVKGEYDIILQGGHDNNYEYQLVNGTMQVHPVLPQIELSLQKQDENVFSVSLISTGGEILDLGIAWNIHEHPTLESNENIATYGNIEDLNDEVSGQYDTVLAALQPNKVYYLRAYAKNSAGLVYSNTVELNTIGDDKIIVFPNPAAGAFTIWVPTQYIGSTINIFSMGGTLVKSIAIKNNSTFVQPGELAQGTYLLKIFKEGAPHDLAKSIKVVIR